MKNYIEILAAQSVKDEQVIRSSNGRHIASGNIVGKPTASRVSLSDGEKRPKAVQDAFKREAALKLLGEVSPDFLLDVNSAKAVIIDAEKKADAARREASKVAVK